MSVSAVCPGSFDPITNGHLDVVERVAARFDRVVVAVLVNPSKEGLFPIEQRLDLIRRTTAHLDNVEVDTFEGLLVDFCHAHGIDIICKGLLVDFCHAHDIDLICKGLRAVSDVEYELQMAQMNQRIGDVETMFMSTSPEWSYLSSSLVKEVARLGGRIEGTVPPLVEDAIRARFDELG